MIEIIEFKTGQESDLHRLQLGAYYGLQKGQDKIVDCTFDEQHRYIVNGEEIPGFSKLMKAKTFYPTDNTEAMDQGTWLHDLFGQILSGVDVDVEETVVDWEKEAPGIGWKVRATAKAASFVQAIASKLIGNVRIQVESGRANLVRGFAGTMDACIESTAPGESEGYLIYLDEKADSGYRVKMFSEQELMVLYGNFLQEAGLSTDSQLLPVPETKKPIMHQLESMDPVEIATSIRAGLERELGLPTDFTGVPVPREIKEVSIQFRDLGRKVKEIEGKAKPAKQLFHALHANYCDQLKQWTAPIENRRRELEEIIRAHEIEEQRKREEAARAEAERIRKEEERRRKEEEERRRKEEEARRREEELRRAEEERQRAKERAERLAAEAAMADEKEKQKKIMEAEAARKAAEEAELKAEEDRKAAEAAQAQFELEKAEAEKRAKEAAAAPANAILLPKAEKLATSTRKITGYQVENLREMLWWMLNNLHSEEFDRVFNLMYGEPKKTKLTDFCKSFTNSQGVLQVQGVKAVEKIGISSR